MKAILHQEADAEFQSAIEFYQTESRELAVAFYREVLVALVRIESHPKAWPRLRGAVRNVLLGSFPTKFSTPLNRKNFRPGGDARQAPTKLLD